MADRLRQWIEDDEPLELWNTRRLFYEALDLGITDRRVIANAMALVDAANEFSKAYPGVSYDQIVNALITGVDPRFYLTWGVRRWWHRVRLFVVQSRIYRRTKRRLKGWRRWRSPDTR